MFGHLIARGVRGGDVVQLLGGVPKKSLCPPWRRFHVRHSGRMHTPPLGNPIGEPRVQRTGPVAIAGLETRRQLVATVPSLTRRALQQASANGFRPEPG
jgi:hypothetical protein